MKLPSIDITRRGLLRGVAGGAMAMSIPGILSRSAHAAAIDKLEIIIGFAPGGGTDRSVRVIGPALAKALGITAPVEYTHAPGAGTVIATRKMLSGRSDGSLINAIPVPYTAWNIKLEKGGFGLDDLAWVGGYFDDPNVLLVKSDSKYNTIDEFIEDARKSEKTVSVSAPMSASHAATVVLREMTGAKLKPVPFDGGSPSRNAVAGGHVDACLAPYWSALHVLEQTKAIGIFADENPAPEMWQPVPANEAMDIDFPELVEPYAFQISAKAAERNPETYNALIEGFAAAMEDPDTREAAKEARRLDLFMRYRNPESCNSFVKDYLALLSDFHDEMQRDVENL